MPENARLQLMVLQQTQEGKDEVVCWVVAERNESDSPTQALNGGKKTA